MTARHNETHTYRRRRRLFGIASLRTSLGRQPRGSVRRQLLHWHAVVLSLDLDCSLPEQLGRGREEVWLKAIEIEADRLGQGNEYVAGAIQRATRGGIKSGDVLAGFYRQGVAL